MTSLKNELELYAGHLCSPPQSLVTHAPNVHVGRPSGIAAAKAAGKKLPGVHTSRFESLPQTTLRTGVTAITSVALSLLQ
jgi:hypothetical protein